MTNSSQSWRLEDTRTSEVQSYFSLVLLILIIPILDYDVMSAAMYPKEAKDFFKFRQQYGPVDKLDTRHFLLGPEMGEEFDVDIEQGKTLSIKTLTPGLEVFY